VGIGCVLVFWAVILGAAAIVSAVVLGLWSWWKQRRAVGYARVLKVLAAAALPFLLVGYGGVAFGGYAIWCETVRHVDAGIGDVWQVPVGNDHYFCMIDVPENGYLLKGGCSGSPIVDEISELAATDDLVIGDSKSQGAFELDTRTGTLLRFTSMEAVLARTTPRPLLRSANDFYGYRRWGYADAVAAVLIAVQAIAITILWYFSFFRWRNSGTPSPAAHLSR
jgi:hypothetical protein